MKRAHLSQNRGNQGWRANCKLGDDPVHRIAETRGFIEKRSSAKPHVGIRPIPLAEVFSAMHGSYDGMSGTQLTERPHEYVPNDRSTDLPIASQDLLQGQRQVWIDHGGTLYCLKATSNGRLYLTK